MSGDEPTLPEVWAVSCHHDDDYRGYWETDLDYGVFLSKEGALAVIEPINKQRTERFQAIEEDSWRYNERVSLWKLENFDKPVEDRTPRPRRRSNTGLTPPATELLDVEQLEVRP